MSANVKFIIIIAAISVWVISWIVRRHNPSLGRILSWAATVLAAVGIILMWVL